MPEIAKIDPGRRKSTFSIEHVVRKDEFVTGPRLPDGGVIADTHRQTPRLVQQQ